MSARTYWLLVVVACLPFLPGLTGPFLLDDLPNLEGIAAWANGQASLNQILHSADAGPLGRPISVLSFAATAATTGMTPAGFKATNLLLHLANGLLAAALLQRLLFRSGGTRVPATWFAWMCAAVWVVLPLHVPTVLYAVQRMTLLAATFSLLALLSWTIARQRLDSSPRDRWALALLWLGTPLLTVASALAKEIGLLVPLYCLVLELTVFAPAAGQSRPRHATWFARLTGILPVLAGSMWLALHPAYVLNGYQDRGYSMAQRLLTEARAVWEYASLTVVPQASGLGLYQDTFPLSTGLLAPPTTVLALTALLAAVAVALALRRRAPLLSAAIGMFLVGHALEGSVFALELFFPHRNYLPSLWLVMGAASLVLLVRRKTDRQTNNYGLVALLATAFIGYASVTAGRSWVWADYNRLLTHELALNPNSLRLRSDLAVASMERGDLATTLMHLDAAERIAPRDELRSVHVWRTLAYCIVGQPTPAPLLASLADGRAQRITPYTMRALEILAEQAENGRCHPLPNGMALPHMIRWLETVPQPANAPAIWRSRYALARLMAVSGDLRGAQREALQAFRDSGNSFPAGVLAFQLSNSLGDRRSCESVYRTLRNARRTDDPREEAVLKSFSEALKPTRPL